MNKQDKQEPAPSARILARREYSGPAFLSGAFRPFFLGAAVWAVVGIAYWLALYNGWVPVPNNVTGRDWHIHEMLFGFAGAAVGGFILTAVPNWTGRLPVRGWSLAGLTGLWLVGRLTMLSGITQVMLLDVAFLFVLAAVVIREVIGGRNRRNYIVGVIIALLATANLLMHLEWMDTHILDGHGWRFGLAMLLSLLGLIGGRVTPSFTRNVLARQFTTGMQSPRLPAKPGGKIDKIVMLFSAVSLLIWVFFPAHMVTGILLCLSGMAQLFRLSRWQGIQVWNQSIVVVLHIAYAWLGLGLLLLGVSILWDSFLESDAIHGLTIGAIGIMIAAIMSRASLGHSGLPIKAGPGLISIYILIAMAALSRLMASVMSAQLMSNLAGLVWIAGFTVFTVLFAPIYFRKRRPR